MKKFIIVMLFIVALISCDNQTSKVDDTNEKGIKIQIQNKTEYELTEIIMYNINFENLKQDEISGIKLLVGFPSSNYAIFSAKYFSDSSKKKDVFYALSLGGPKENTLIIIDEINENGIPILQMLKID